MRDRADGFSAVLAVGLICGGLADSVGAFVLCYVGGLLLLAVLTDPPSKWRKTDG